ncbi:hypothetical protein [Methanoplanus endosymbiosus]|uniref:Uncharacterized protein n=1 Tax=Methanoplanus endosymbiosus TaxID=33865 RepID=A0A9E7PMV4_9EURY|nr:hypothetical protein [Methanoplanus endosymbiosus]UUX93170.1 hypothetical protein L6E24_03345 [Methanoplanus endosymbiosus]
MVKPEIPAFIAGIVSCDGCGVQKIYINQVEILYDSILKPDRSRSESVNI